ncbi:magnesium/cobalt transporter [Pseudomonas sp. ATCC 13867]|uniref:magnesium transporter CorA family protein n=1 Tax=Pseudomonas sp. ATCC 13867 TaxID=1294143 RepID=UPI0002C4F5CD|nr:magnesium transporter CorA family protein [Pseudomonas sp. ATCC 13867]AGI26653.1 magnesium/cobalt transporter [Pseudomonas sp. ATCC 13867]RFQ33513.1 magnesium transporter [Pseudomonas sp. ATCC 13867]
MITYYTLVGDRLVRHNGNECHGMPSDTLWIDLFQPTPEEEQLLESIIAVDVPTREEMAEIEDSSRFYENNGALYMTTTVVGGIREHKPSTSEVTCVLTPHWLVTVRYTDLLAFRTFETRTQRGGCRRASDQLFVTLMDSVVDRIADVLETVQKQLDSLSNGIFREGQAEGGKTDLQGIVKQLGRSNSLLSKLNESLLSISRPLAYFRQGSNGWISEEVKLGMKSVERDVRSLSEYQSKMSGEITFLLDATLGLINIEQNSIIKVFSIAAVLFLPPTLVGTVYGMNFQHMPELAWLAGYPMALVAMVVSAIIPYYWFKYKGWL